MENSIKNEQNTKSLGVSIFGINKKGEIVEKVIISNKNGMKATIINYGATLTKLFAPNYLGEYADVVLGFEDLQMYEDNPYFGSILGRIAGRLNNGAFVLNNKSYNLELNEVNNHLHGGSKGFHNRLWEIESYTENSATFYLFSKNGEGGYPGDVKVWVTYLLTSKNELIIEYNGSVNQLSPLSLSHHSWFNLGEESTILEHELEIYRNYYPPTDNNMSHLGFVKKVDKNDLRKKKKVKEIIKNTYLEHGDNYIFMDSNKSICKKVATLFNKSSKRVMEVYTTERCIQFFSGNSLDGSLIGKYNKVYPKFGGLCLECQGYPNGPKNPEIENIMIAPDDQYTQKTIYKFLTEI